MGELLQQAGPWQGLLTGAFAVIAYLVREKSVLQKKVDEGVARERVMLETRLKDREEAKDEYRDQGNAMLNGMAEWTTTAKAMLEALRR